MINADILRPPASDQASHPDHALRADAAANPTLLGAPAVVVGSVALTVFLTAGFNHATVPGTLVEPLPIMIFSCSVLSLIATIWSVQRGEGHLAAVFGLFGTFW